MDTIDYVSDFLFAKGSFWEGAARLFDFGNTLNEYNSSVSPDYIAIYMDWAIVGNDLRKAMTSYVEETEQGQPACPVR